MPCLAWERPQAHAVPRAGVPLAGSNGLRIDYCDDHLIQESSYISGAICMIHTYYISYEAHYFSLLDHTSKNKIRHTISGKLIKTFFHFYFLIQDFLVII